MSKQYKEWAMKLEEKGVQSEELDDLVHHIADEAAADANNGGLEEQLKFFDLNGYSFDFLIQWIDTKEPDDESNDSILAQQEMEDYAQDGEFENMSASEIL